MIRIERSAAGSYRVSGSLRGDGLSLLREALASGPVSCDLSEVEQADDEGVRFLAGVSGRCALVGCPTWLALWIARVREAPARP